MTDNLLGSMYNDFFGPGSGGDGKPPVFDDPDKTKEIEKEVEKDFTNLKEGKDDKIATGLGKDYENAGSSNTGSGINVSDDRPLQDADEALREARALFGSRLGGAEFGADKDQGGNPTGAAGTPGEEAPAAKEKEPETDPMEDLNALIGLASIKHDVKELTDFAKVQKMRKDEGMKAVPVSLHLVFTGNPGTGKTTVARIISRIYKQIGVLSKGQLVEVDRSGLVAGYVGQTALKTQEKINEALGGVLFIDEAYSLSQENDAFGQEAIDTILKAMEDHRDDLVVIVAGYTEPMEKFINSNPGLKSRFNKYIEFPDYSVDELEQIFNMNCDKYEYEVEEEAKKHIRMLISSRKLTHIENFANAREVRNLFEEIVTNQARRIAGLENPTPEDIKLIIPEDLTEEKKEDTSDEVPSDSEMVASDNEEPTLDSVESASGDETEDVSVDESADSGDSGAEEEHHEDGGDLDSSAE